MRKFSYWFLKNLYSSEEVTNLVQFSENNFDPSFTDNPARGVTKTSTVKIIPWAKIRNHMHKSHEAVKYMNSSEIGYDLYDMTDFQSINYNVYDSSNKGEYDWHIDATLDESPVDIKLTVVINVSTEPYEGGGFQLFRHVAQTVPEIEIPGSMIIFPSFWNHKVLPVTSGTRRTISYWVNGPKFR
jgi:PKHD-type hydroxylase